MTYYQIFGLDERATQAQIKSAYRRLSMQFHPDRNQGQDELFKLVNEAYQVLSDPQKRRDYDTGLKQKSDPKVQIDTFRDELTYVHPDVEKQISKWNLDRDIRNVRGRRKWSRIGVAAGLGMMLSGMAGLTLDDVRPYSQPPIPGYTQTSQQQKQVGDYALSALLALVGLAGTANSRRNSRTYNEVLENLQRRRRKL